MSPVEIPDNAAHFRDDGVFGDDNVFEYGCVFGGDCIRWGEGAIAGMGQVIVLYGQAGVT